jgi:hypothetical protein
MASDTTPCLFGYLGNIISLGQNIVKFGSIQSEIVQGKGIIIIIIIY